MNKTYIIFLFFLTLLFSQDQEKTNSGISVDDVFKQKKEKKTNSISTIKFEKVEELTEIEKNYTLKDLEFEDIDLETYGKYEDFLNKYYTENNVKSSTNSFSKNKKPFVITGIVGGIVPVGTNFRERHKTGPTYGFEIKTPLKMYLLKKKIELVTEFSFSNLLSSVETVGNYKMTNMVLKAHTELTKNLHTSLGLGMTPSSASKHSIVDNTFGIAIHANTTYFIKVKDFDVGINFKALLLVSGILNPPGGSTGELIGINLKFKAPIKI